MRVTTAIRLGAAAIAALDIAATVEAWRSGHIALGVVTLLAAVGALSVIVLSRRPAVLLRPDLAAWTARTSAATGEPESRLVNRAVAHHRAALDGLGRDGSEHDDIEHDHIEHDHIEHDDIEHERIEHDHIEHERIEHDDIEHERIEHDHIERDDIEHDDIEHEERTDA